MRASGSVGWLRVASMLTSARSSLTIVLLPWPTSTDGAPSRTNKKPGTNVTRVVIKASGSPPATGRGCLASEAADEGDELNDHDQRPGVISASASLRIISSDSSQPYRSLPAERRRSAPRVRRGKI